MAAIKEPLGLITGSNLRPDGVTLTPWSRGKCLAWDATTPDTVAPTHLLSTLSQGGAAASHAATIKDHKYAPLSNTHHLVAVAIETFGAWNPEGLGFVKELG